MAWCMVLLASAVALASGSEAKAAATAPQVLCIGTPHLVDLWLKTSNLKEIAKYNPDRQIVYHLFTRENPTVSQPLLMGNEGLIRLTNFDPERRCAILLHGWQDNVSANFINVVVPAFLAAENMNVIAIDWGVGAGSSNYATAVANTRTTGEAVARFVNWLNEATGINPSSYFITGHGLGAHMAGIIGRNLNGQAGYITALDASFAGWITNDHRFRPSDGDYTEAIHTNAGNLGYLADIADVDFYPNGGIDMPGCSSIECDHARSYFYYAESLRTGGFRGSRCASYITAMLNECMLPGRLNMGGLVPKNRSQGVYYVRTRRSPPFSRE